MATVADGGVVLQPFADAADEAFASKGATAPLSSTIDKQTDKATISLTGTLQTVTPA